ncbi:MAG TPA: alpha/beta fold hydrolase [Microthrixaceae bacterium]|nr:alpha/beta fold hydrolase [Microthrixaceae bacterium]
MSPHRSPGHPSRSPGRSPGRSPDSWPLATLFFAGIALLAVTALVASCTSSTDEDAKLRSKTSAADPDRAVPQGADRGDKNKSPDYQVDLVDSDCVDRTTDTAAIDCYKLVVPENRAKPTGRQVELPVLRIRSVGTPAAGPPLVYLHGGPGAGAVEGWLAWQQLMDGVPRDLYVYDQRGGGHANPRLDCPERSAALASTLASHPAWAEARQTVGDSIAACHKRLRSQGVELSQYDTWNSVQDLEDLRRAIGAESLALVGSSYGTRLALSYQAQYPDRVDSLALSGVDPPGTGGPKAERSLLEPALNRLFESCNTDLECAAKFPNLKVVFDEAARRLDATPANLSDPFPIRVTGDELNAGVFAGLYDSATIPLLPAAITRIASGDEAVWSSIGSQVAPFLGDDSAFGAQIGISCGDLAASGSEGSSKSASDPGSKSSTDTSSGKANSSRDETAAASDPGRSRDLVLSGTYSFCGFWATDTAERHAQASGPATSPKSKASRNNPPPTLVIAGELDPITPASDARAAAKKLAGQYVEIRRGGHDVMLSDPCARLSLRAFMVDPTAPVDGCTKEIAAPFA